jgi:hypothetical protein
MNTLLRLERIFLRLKLASLLIKQRNFFCAHEVLDGYIFKRLIIYIIYYIYISKGDYNGRIRK